MCCLNRFERNVEIGIRFCRFFLHLSAVCETVLDWTVLGGRVVSIAMLFEETTANGETSCGQVQQIR